MADIAAVIANFNGSEHLPDCLASLRSQTRVPVDVLVVDAGSHDDSVAVAKAAGTRVLVAENRGLGHLYNVGAAATTAEFLLLANNDLAFDERCVAELAAALEADDANFAADPRQHDWSGERLIHARTVLRRGPLLRTPIPGLVIDPVVQAEDVVPTLHANAGAMLVRRDVLVDLGGFDETFFLDYEDLDLCWRAWLRGRPSVYVPSAWLRHKVGMSASPTVSRRRLRASHHNLLRFALKCLPPTAAARVLAGELLRFPRHGGAAASGALCAAREARAILRLRRELEPTRALYSDLLEMGERC
jgi:GT2 family glycosyltransferase